MHCSNKQKCSCPNTKCANHGRCCDCVAKHKQDNNLPYCLRTQTTKKHA